MNLLTMNNKVVVTLYIFLKHFLLLQYWCQVLWLLSILTIIFLSVNLDDFDLNIVLSLYSNQLRVIFLLSDY